MSSQRKVFSRYSGAGKLTARLRFFFITNLPNSLKLTGFRAPAYDVKKARARNCHRRFLSKCVPNNVTKGNRPKVEKLTQK